VQDCSNSFQWRSLSSQTCSKLQPALCLHWRRRRDQYQVTCGCASPDRSTCKVKFSGILTKLCDNEQNYLTTYNSLNKNMQLRTNTAHTDNCLSTWRPILHVVQHENYFILFYFFNNLELLLRQEDILFMKNFHSRRHSMQSCATCWSTNNFQT